MKIFQRKKNLEYDTFWSIIKRFEINMSGSRGLFTYITYTFRPATLLKTFQHMCFPVNIAEFSRTTILKNICERLLLYVYVT